MIVLDSNVVAYLYLPGEHTAKVEALLDRDPDWPAPVLWRSEFRDIPAGYPQVALVTMDARLLKAFPKRAPFRWLPGAEGSAPAVQGAATPSPALRTRYSSASGMSRSSARACSSGCRLSTRAQAFQRRIASSLSAGRTASAFSNHDMASRRPS